MFSYPKIYDSLETLPIYNWDKVQVTNDLRWLLHKPEVRVSKYLQQHLARVYIDLIGKYQTGKNRLIEAKKAVAVLLIDLVLEVAKSDNEKKIMIASTIIQAVLIDSTQEQILHDANFADTPEEKLIITQITVAIRKYKDQIDKLKRVKKQTIYDQLANVEAILGVKINIYKCPVRQWQSYISTVNVKVNAQTKGLN